MLQAKGAMLDTENAMNGITEAGDDATDSVDKMNESLAQVGRGVNWQNVTEGLHTITSGMQAIMKKAWQMGEALVNATLGAGTWADELMTTAAQMSTAEYTVTTEDLQRMRKTATLIDTDVDVIVAARSRLYKGLGNDTKATMSALEMLGIDRNGKSNADIFWEAGSAILALSDDTEQEAQATALFGKSWKQLIPLFRAGREEYDKTMESWSVVSDKQVSKLGEMDDQYQKLTGEWETFKMEILSTFSGPLTQGMETLTGFVKELNNYLQTPEGKAMLEQMGNTITTLIEDLTKVSPEDVVNGLKGVVDGITGSLKWIADNRGLVVGAVEAFIGAWAALKTAEGVTTVLKLIDGIKGLSAGKVAADAAAAGAAAGTSWASGFANAVISVAPALASVLGITAVAITPAMWANASDDKRVENKRLDRLASASMLQPGIDRDFLERATNALGLKWHGGNEAEVESILMGMSNRSDLQKAQLQMMLGGSYTSYGNRTWDELMSYWGGEPMDMGRLNAILESVTDAYQRMAEQSEKTSEINNTVKEAVKEQTASQNNKTDNADLPGKIATAVAGAVKGVPITVNVNVDGAMITRTVNRGLAGSLSGLLAMGG